MKTNITPPAESIPTAAEIEQMEDDLEAYLNSPLAFADYRLIMENIEQPENIPAVSLRRIAGASWVRTLLPPRRELQRFKEWFMNDYHPELESSLQRSFSKIVDWHLNLCQDVGELQLEAEERREAAGLPPRADVEGAKSRSATLTPEVIAQAVREGLEPLFAGLGRTIEKEGRRGTLATLQAAGEASPLQLADASRLWAETVKGTDHGAK